MLSGVVLDVPDDTKEGVLDKAVEDVVDRIVEDAMDTVLEKILDRVAEGVLDPVLEDGLDRVVEDAMEEVFEDEIEGVEVGRTVGGVTKDDGFIAVFVVDSVGVVEVLDDDFAVGTIADETDVVKSFDGEDVGLLVVFGTLIVT